ncbi:hypothetical protein B0H12DRAFT_618695 [Mycena haematopus]|nr:hypothetical protein B0H12DRAFT_618695 [Mycena haematopus]
MCISPLCPWSSIQNRSKAGAVTWLTIRGSIALFLPDFCRRTSHRTHHLSRRLPPTTTMTCWTVNVFLAVLLITRPITAAIVIDSAPGQDQAVMQMPASMNAHCPHESPSKFYRFVNPDTERSRYSPVYGAEDDDEFDGVAARVFGRQVARAVPLYHILNPATQDSFYTREIPSSSASLHGYVDMGIAAYVFPKRICGGVPLFRLVKGGDNHFYTADGEEREMMMWNEGFEDAGIVGYVIGN